MLNRMVFEELLTAPAERELSACREFLRRQEELYRRDKVRPVKATGATVAPATDPALRARESLVRVLFNHDDFVTVR